MILKKFTLEMGVSLMFNLQQLKYIQYFFWRIQIIKDILVFPETTNLK
jgi:hypothetical protein